MSRAATLIFAILAYAIFFATFLYLIVFVGDLSFARRTVDVGPQAPVAVAVVVDVALIALFGLQHSVMARQGFKRWWTRFVPAAGRAQRLCACCKHRADDPVRRLAADSGTGVERQCDSASRDQRPHLGRLLDRLADGPAQHVPDQPFRAVWIAAGMAEHARAARPRRPSSASLYSTNGSATRSISASSSPSGPLRR